MVMKNKKLRLFTTPNLKLARPRARKKRREEEEEENMGERERSSFGYGGEEGVVLCENEVEWKGIYREGGGLVFGHFGWEWVGN